MEIMQDVKYAMKKFSFFVLFLSMIFLTTCAASSKCECENSNKYSKRKSKISLIDSQKNSTFVLQKDVKILFLI